jgi:hypothetical protein
MPSHSPTDGEPFSRVVYRAMKQLGWLLPATIEEVRQAEADLERDPVELPESLRDPMKLLDRNSRAE